MITSAVIEITGRVMFSGEVERTNTALEARLAVIEAIFKELSKNLDCTQLTIGDMSWSDYKLRIYTAQAERV